MSEYARLPVNFAGAHLKNPKNWARVSLKQMNDAANYWSALATALKVPFTVVPILVTPAIMRTERKPAIRAYSMDVAPCYLSRNAVPLELCRASTKQRYEAVSPTASCAAGACAARLMGVAITKAASAAPEMHRAKVKDVTGNAPMRRLTYSARKPPRLAKNGLFAPYPQERHTHI